MSLKESQDKNLISLQHDPCFLLSFTCDGIWQTGAQVSDYDVPAWLFLKIHSFLPFILPLHCAVRGRSQILKISRGKP